MIRKNITAAAILTLALCLGGCSSSYNASSSPKGSSDYAAEESADSAGYYDEAQSAADEAYEGEEGAGTRDNGETDSALRAQDGQKIVYRADVSMQTLEYDKTVSSIRKKIKEMGGFSESESEYDKNYDWYYESSASRNTRTLNITARIPSEKFEAFLNSLSGDGKIMSKSVNAENISQTYANKESYKKALEKEQERLLAMMDKAQTIDEMIAVEARLSEVERQLNTYKTDLAAMDKDVEYSTISLNVEEVKRYTEQAQTFTFREKVGFAFNDAISSFKDFCEGIILYVVGHFPYLILLAIVLILFIRWLGRRRAQKVALLTNPEYAKVMTAKVQAKAEADARKFAAKEEKRKRRGGLFGKKKAGEAEASGDAGAASEAAGTAGAVGAGTAAGAAGTSAGAEASVESGAGTSAEDVQKPEE